MPEPDLITTAELARRLGISPRTLSRYVERGYLVPALRLPSGQFRWREDEVREQLREWQQ